MAYFDFYAPTDMLSSSTWYGYIINASSTNITITDYYREAYYYGNGFTYSGDSVTGGTLTSYYQYEGGILTHAITGMSVDAARAASLIESNNVPALLSLVAVGNDTIEGSDFADRLDGFNGNDLIYGWGDNDTVYGGAGNDTLNGQAGNDILNGEAGADRMAGGIGDDRMYIDNVGDRVVESANQGYDRVHTSISFTLAAGQHIEAITTTNQAGTGAFKLTGNEIAQTITGNNGANIISGAGGSDSINGAGGNDLIYGNAGNDRLAGGAGYDQFIFDSGLNAASNVDTIVDFNPAQDTIRLQNAVMAGLGSVTGTLNSAMFWKSTTGLAHDSNDRIIYETDTGKLFYDNNGSAAGGSTHLATLSPNLALGYADFLVI